jgi:aminotransferase
MTTPAPSISRRISRKASLFTESVIREMTREAMKYGAVNLSQGFPDFAAPEDIKRVAMQAIADDVNQYAITWGAKAFRDAIASKTKWYLGLEIDPETEITVTCGSTEGMISAMMATVDPGDEVIVFEPFYENYAPDAILSDAKPRHVALRAPDWTFDRDELRAAFNLKTKAIIICNPNNPTGKVFTRAEMEFIAALCQEFDALCFTDEIYEHILYPRAGAEIAHISMAQIAGMRDRTVIVNSMSKTYSVTGWRVGYCIASPEITSAIRKVHDFLTVGAAAPLQAAGALRFVAAAVVLRSTTEGLRGAPRSDSAGTREGRVWNLLTRRRLLRHDRHQRVWIQERRRIHPPPDSRGRRRLRSRIELLQSRRVGTRRTAGAVLFLQER